MWDMIITLAVVLLAFIYVLNRYFSRKYKKKESGGGCASCGGCCPPPDGLGRKGGARPCGE